MGMAKCFTYSMVAMRGNKLIYCHSREGGNPVLSGISRIPPQAEGIEDIRGIPEVQRSGKWHVPGIPLTYNAMLFIFF
jgi:hypothetical protein